MAISRRAALAQTAAGLFAGTALLQGEASAGTDHYQYDGQGRLIGVYYADGSSIVYTYDDAGNRTQLSQAGPAGSTFTATIQITGQVPVNLFTLAQRHGYDGARNATITFEVGNGITITAPGGGSTVNAAGSDGSIAVDTGTWPGGYTINLTLTILNGGTVRGGGGGGGSGGETFSGYAGGNGGDAIYCRLPMTINVNSGGKLQGGGAGGRGGDAGYDYADNITLGGGGGGGGQPNGAAGPGGSTEISGSPGTAGTTSAAGTGGAGASNGGFYASNGSGGGTYGQNAGGFGGYAVRKNGNSVTVNNSGTINGTVG